MGGTMNDACAIEARYVNHKNVQGRGVLQVILEIPVEHTVEFFNKFGHPDPGKEKRVGLALLATEVHEVSVKDELSKNAQKAKRNFEDLPYSQQAALLCKDERFHGELRVLSGDKSRLVYAVASLDQDKHDTYASDCIHADHNLKKILGISSKTELDDPDNKTKQDKFIQLRSELLSKTRSYPEQRGKHEKDTNHIQAR